MIIGGLEFNQLWKILKCGRCSHSYAPLFHKIYLKTLAQQGRREGGECCVSGESLQDLNWVWLLFVQRLQFLSQLSCEKLKLWHSCWGTQRTTEVNKWIWSGFLLWKAAFQKNHLKIPTGSDRFCLENHLCFTNWALIHMGDVRNHEPKEDSSAQTLLLGVNRTHEEVEEEWCNTHLDETLQRLESFLCVLGFHQSSVLSIGLSWTVFFVIGVLLPVVVLELSNCEGCDKYQIKDFELDIVALQACLAAVSLLCLSHNLRKYGIRKFLFVDRFSGQMVRFRDQYVQKITVSIAHFR